MRTILSLNQNWQFALQRPGMEKEGLLFTQVTLPHDWMISSPFDRNMKQGEAQGFLSAGEPAGIGARCIWKRSRKRFTACVLTGCMKTAG